MEFPESIFKKSWWKDKTLSLAVCLLQETKWPAGKTIVTSALQLSKLLEWNWRTVYKELFILQDAGFLQMDNILEKGIKKLKITIAVKK